MFDVNAGKFDPFYGSGVSANKMMENEDVHKMAMSILNSDEDLIHESKLDSRHDEHKTLDPSPLRTVPLDQRNLPTLPVILLQTSNSASGLRTIPSVSSMQVPPISTLVSLEEASLLPYGSSNDLASDDEYDSDKKGKKNKKRKVKRDDGEGNILTNEQFWLERFNQLKDFNKQYNHSNPSYLQHSQLYSWLHRQKFLFRKGKLPKDRYEMLVDMGVHFDYHWDEMYVLLKEYKDEHNTSTVPMEFDTKLSSWVWAQIYAWRSGKLSEDRIRKMEDLGLSPDMDSSLKPPKPPSKKKRKKLEDQDTLSNADKRSRSAEKKSEQNWVLMYKKLKEFKNVQHSLTVPMKFDKKLSLWVRTQRKMWREGKLFDWKQKKLEKLGLTPNFEMSSKKDLSELDDTDAQEHAYQVQHLVHQGQLMGSHLDNEESEGDMNIQAEQALDVHPSEHDMGHMIHTSEDDNETQEEPVYDTNSSQQSTALLGLSDSSSSRSSSKHIPEEISHLDMLASYLNHGKEQPYLEHVSSSDLNG